ncbi:MAG: hypothetical protein SF028_12310, partial [Candidatus Sumerlaeia bacterium]|nr:hypothetical protein [Candidatus Sumerlaeia bacterium]
RPPAAHTAPAPPAPAAAPSQARDAAPPAHRAAEAPAPPPPRMEGPPVLGPARTPRENWELLNR